MAVEQRQVMIAKEVDDVALLLVEIVKQVKSGKPVAEMAAGVMDELVQAISGVDQIDDEWKEDRSAVMATMGYRLGELTDAIIGG
jgi:hypothetical protein